MLVKTDVFDVNQNVKKRQTKVQSPPKPIFVDQKQTERGRSEAKYAGVQKLSSFIWTLMVTKENEKWHGVGWVNSEGVG